MHLNNGVRKSAPSTPARMTGLGLPLAIFIITVMAFIAVAINELSEAGAKSAGVNALSMRAFYAAESGANVILAAASGGAPCSVATTLNLTTGNFIAGLSQCSATVTCTPAGTLYLINSRGVCGNAPDTATRIIEVVVE
ncbi:MAG: hypothetical protein MI867_21710 [Pseudomonadales bacterium]|nr:hypothetical protein [Pseudomonadales bacterium]